MAILTRHEHCSHSGTLQDHEDEFSECSDVMDHVTVDITKKQPIPYNPRFRQLSTLQDFIMDQKHAKDSRSIYITNINPRVSINQLERIFANFGPFNNVIIQHKHCGFAHSGYAILELSDSATKSLATMLNGTRLASQKISVAPKRLTLSSHENTRGHGRGFEHGHGYGNGRGFEHGHGYGYGRGFEHGHGYGRGQGEGEEHGRQHRRRHNGRGAGWERQPLREITHTSGHNQRL